MLTRRAALSIAFALGRHRGFAAGTGLVSLSGRVIDRHSGLPIACQLSIQTPEGAISDPGQAFSPTILRAGEFQFFVPPGETRITVERGFDYRAVTRRMLLAPGQVVHLTIALERVTPLRGRGWYCGDNHIHLAHGERQLRATFADVALAGRSAGLDYLSVAQDWNVTPIDSGTLARACAPECDAGFQMTWNLEAPKNYFRGDVSHCLGHGWTLGMKGIDPNGKDVVVQMLNLSTPDYDITRTPAPNFEIHAGVHRLGGIVSYTHPCRWWRGKWGGKAGYPAQEDQFISNLAQELPFDTLAGPTYDTLDVLMQPEEADANQKALRLWFELLNHGYRIPATASSDSTFDNPGGGTPGKARVYTRIDEDFSWDTLALAMKAGRNLITTGPLLEFQINGRGPGESVVVPPSSKVDARLSAWASGELGEWITRIDIVLNGETVRVFSPKRRTKQHHAAFRMNVQSNGWCVAVCYGSGPGRMAVSNPIYLAASAGEPFAPPAPVPAQVEALVSDARTGELLNGECEVFRRAGAASEFLFRTTFQEGRLQASVPAVARLLVRAPGYDPLERSVFLDDPGIRERTLNLRINGLLSWRTFEEIRILLSRVRLDFPLRHS